jgi:hypothetical protein
MTNTEQNKNMVQEKTFQETGEQPMTGIKHLHDNDVPLGRGGGVNSHKGHKRYMKMVQDRKLEYVQCKKSDKMKVSHHPTISRL